MLNYYKSEKKQQQQKTTTTKKNDHVVQPKIAGEKLRVGVY